MSITCPFESAEDLLRYVAAQDPAQVNLGNRMTHAFVVQLLRCRWIESVDVSVTSLSPDDPLFPEPVPDPDGDEIAIYACTPAGLAHLAAQDAIAAQLRQQQLEQQRQRDADRAEAEKREQIHRREDQAWRILALVVPSVVSMLCVWLTALLR